MNHCSACGHVSHQDAFCPVSGCTCATRQHCECDSALFHPTATEKYFARLARRSA